MIRLRQLTKWLLGLTFVGLVLWNVYNARHPEANGYISYVLKDYSQDVWAISYVFGLLCGHWFWNVRRDFLGSIRYWILTAISTVVVLINIVTHQSGVIWEYQEIPLFAGIAVGRVFWYQLK